MLVAMHADDEIHGLDRVDVFDLRGVRCPLNWARAKVRLESVEPGCGLELRIDDPKGARDIPRAAEAEGFDVLRVVALPDEWAILLAR